MYSGRRKQTYHAVGHAQSLNRLRLYPNSSSTIYVHIALVEVSHWPNRLMRQFLKAAAQYATNITYRQVRRGLFARLAHSHSLKSSVGRTFEWLCAIPTPPMRRSAGQLKIWSCPLDQVTNRRQMKKAGWLPCLKSLILLVEQRGIEPLTSALRMEKQAHCSF